MFEGTARLFLKVFGSRNERLLKGYSTVTQQAAVFEDRISRLDDNALKAKTGEFKAALAGGAAVEDIIAEAFAVVREAARRNVGMRHFDVQLVGGHTLYDGRIAEMATGEGKTLAATLAVYLTHLTGRKVHIVTVNDYLAQRDADWMGPVYEALGLSVGAIQADMDTAGDDRKDQYTRDVTYGTNNEFGFDYLRDNMKMSLDRMVQGRLEYAIIDEVDSILIDEARTPLIISGPAVDDVSRYRKADQVARKLLSLQAGYDRAKKQLDAAERGYAAAKGRLAEAKKAKDGGRSELAQRQMDEAQTQITAAEQKAASATQYYEVEYDRKQVHLTHEGVGAAQETAGVGSFFTGSNIEWPHLIEQALRAHITFEREKDYVVMDEKVVIVDEFTGRLMHGRQWSDGLHQAVEAKEAVPIKEETQTLATITLQNFFKLYDLIAGMTGTAATEAEEFMRIYGMEVVTIPTNEPCIRQDFDDVIYKTIEEKFNAIAEQIHETSRGGRPVLVGTISIEKSEMLSAALKRGYGLAHEVLNAKQHAREALIVSKAGQQHAGRDGRRWGNVTIATNMAGRGTDIKLGPGVADIGGLHILGTERHEARRIDNQLRGRAGRQGDAGSSQFFLSFDDDLMRIFAPEWTVKALSWIGWEEGQPITHNRISKGIEKAQKKVEERNFEARKSLLEYDEVMDYQRKIFYSRRRKILAGEGLRELIYEMITGVVVKHCRIMLGADYPAKCIIEWASSVFGTDIDPADITGEAPDQIEGLIKDQAKEKAAASIGISLGEYLEDYADPKSWDLQGLSRWAMSTFKVSLSISKLKNLSPEQIEEHISAAASDQIEKRDCSQLSVFLRPDFSLRTLCDWARAKFDLDIETDRLSGLNSRQIEQMLCEKTNEQYRRREEELGNDRLGELEKYVLLQIYDGTWKDHLYSMDHLKISIWTRSFAEKDPKIEYKREGFRMFNEMLDAIEDRVTDVIFKVRLDPGTAARSVWTVSRTMHDQMSQFEAAARAQSRQTEAAMQPQEPVRQIKLARPKVGRNDPCPCGSGRKYKKCCGAAK